MTTTPFADGPRRVIPAHRLRAKGQDDAVAPRTEGDGRVRQSTQRWCTQHRPPGVPHATSRSNHCVRNAGCNRRDRGDYARVLFHFCTRGCGCARASGVPRALIRAKRREEFGRPRAFQIIGAMAHGPQRRGFLRRERGKPRARAVITTGVIPLGCMKIESGCEDCAQCCLIHNRHTRA